LEVRDLDLVLGEALQVRASVEQAPALLRLLAPAHQHQVPLHLVPRTLSEPAAEALEVRDLDLVLGEALQVRASVEQAPGALGQALEVLAQALG
jgi:plasmid stability protein